MTWDETIAQLDHILQADRQRKEGSLTLLRSVVRSLDSAPPIEGPADGDVEVVRRRATTTAGAPYVPIPKRTTHGGRFGPAMIAKFRRQALG